MTCFLPRSMTIPALVFMLVMSLAVPVRGHVNLNSPSGGEVLSPGDEFAVSWQVEIAHDLENWDLWYSITGTDGPWVPIAEDLARGDDAAGSVHSYNWIVPNVTSEQVRIRVRMDNPGTDYEDISDADLAIREPTDADTPEEPDQPAADETTPIPATGMCGLGVMAAFWLMAIALGMLKWGRHAVWEGAFHSGGWGRPKT